MDTMVERVVQVLDEGSVYLLPGRVLRSRVPKKRQPLRKIRKTLPQTTTGEKEILDKSKEKQRKDVKDRHPNTSLKWDGKDQNGKLVDNGVYFINLKFAEKQNLGPEDHWLKLIVVK